MNLLNKLLRIEKPKPISEPNLLDIQIDPPVDDSPIQGQGQKKTQRNNYELKFQILRTAIASNHYSHTQLKKICEQVTEHYTKKKLETVLALIIEKKINFDSVEERQREVIDEN